ncbi:hypothetical protein F4808DRAFT_171864 [Astrocystis sublimbata]|nr:hypothetical protein F4808DRAFT_171864 [Astrocystis sublimbata]
MSQKLIPTLHHLNHSAAFRCLWALEELKEVKGIKYHLKTYGRQRGGAPEELKAIFPMGKSPILTLETTEPGKPPPTIQIIPGVLTEAQLILRFLSEEYGDGLWEPTTEEDRNRDIFFQGFSMMTFTPNVDFIVILEALISILPYGVSALFGLILSPLVTFGRDRIVPVLQVLENALSDEKPYFAGKEFGLADFNVSFGMDMSSQRGYFDPAQFPKLRDWQTKVKARSGFINALEKCNGYNLKTFGI